MSFIRILAGLSSLAIMMAIGCHSAPLKNFGGASLTVQTQWLKTYREARGLQENEPLKACKLYGVLAEDKKFPVHKLAELRMYETCPEIQHSNLDRTQLPPYLSDLGLEVALKLAKQAGDKTGEMELAAEKSRQRLTQKEKVKWAELAIERAQELGHKDKVTEYQKRLYKIAPRLDPEPKESDWLEIAMDYRMARDFNKAHEYYEKVIASPNFKLEEKISALKGLRLAYKNARSMEAHIEAALRTVNYLKKAIKLNPRSNSLRQAAYDAEVYYGRAVWTQHRAGEALEIFNGIEKRLKGRVSLAELYWLKGRMAEERGDLDGVATFMDLALKERVTDPELRDKILWYTAWNERKRKNLDAAAALMTDIDVKTQSDFTRVRALYWLGKTLTEAKKEPEAKAVFEKLITVDPLGYYGLLAHRQLGLAIKLQTSSANNTPHVQTPLDTDVAEWLALLDEKESLTNLLDLASSGYKKDPKQNDEGWTLIFKYYAKGGLYMKLYESLGALPPDRRKNILQNHPELLFPQPWAAEVRQAALQYGVAEELIYAIIRQESAFDPKARSIADAFGLMQVLPEIAETMAGANKIPYTHMEDLYTPQINISVGAAFVKELLARHKGQFILAVSAYNSSDNAIRNWMKTRFRGDSLEFIEEIPYEETRGYVRLVMRNMIFYSLLKSKNASIEFPAWVLKLDPS